MTNESRINQISLKAWIRISGAVIAAVLLAVFISRNASTVEIDFLFGSVETRLVWALLLSAGLGLLIGFLIPRLRSSKDD